jgi:CHAD domain-containing protein
MADEKWITTLSLDTPAADAARQVLTARLAAVRSRLAPAVERAGEDVEHVHQLRVASRRAAAALRTFADCLPEEPYRSARKLLRNVRRAAGDARDWDVFAETVRGTDRLAGPAHEPARSYLLGLAAGFRAVAQAKLRDAAQGHATELDDTLTTLPGQARPPELTLGLTAGDLAAKQLGGLFGEFDDAIAAGPKSAGELHRVRIAGKRLRYAIEVFAGCLPPELKDVHYPAVEQAQTLLGGVNDAAVAADRLKAVRSGVRGVTPQLAPLIRPGLDALIAGVKSDAADGKRAFRRWCREWALLLAEHPLGEVLRANAFTPAA